MCRPLVYTIKNVPALLKGHTYTFNVGRAVASSGLHGNIIIFLKVYASVARREQLTRRWGLQKFRSNRRNKTVSFIISDQGLTYCSRRSLGAVGLDQSSSLDSSVQRLFPPPEKPPRSYLHTQSMVTTIIIIIILKNKKINKTNHTRQFILIIVMKY